MILLSFVHVAEEVFIALMKADYTVDGQRGVHVRIPARFNRIGDTYAERHERVRRSNMMHAHGTRARAHFILTFSMPLEQN